MSASNAAARLRRLRRAPLADAPHRAVAVDRQRDAMRLSDSVFARVALVTEQDIALRRPRWRRFPAATAASGVALFFLLLGFAFLLRPRVRALPPSSAIEARLIELPPPKPPEPEKIAPAAPAKIAPAPARPPRAVHRKPPAAKPNPPPAPASAAPSATGSRETIPAAPSAPAANQPAEEEPAEKGGAEIGGSDSGGARAIYAPLPSIPDELRESAFSTVAVAHLIVGPDGKVQVRLTTPTSDPKLNQLILETLHEWKFFPAIKDGVAIASQFDVRIPISVQ